ncbi:hypothetical protein, partial [Akkermansia sp.]|uniref:hypothetical protein n=1 Tax=Akkermansia sp. TaxID=1872421 RepID=UPI003AB45637
VYNMITNPLSAYNSKKTLLSHPSVLYPEEYDTAIPFQRNHPSSFLNDCEKSILSSEQMPSAGSARPTLFAFS